MTLEIVLWASACATVPSEYSGPNIVAPPNSFVVANPAFPPRIAPDTSAPTLTAYSKQRDEAEAHRLGHFNVFRAIEDHGDWIEVETLGGATALGPFSRTEHCYGSIYALDGFKLRLYLPRAALLPVSTRSFFKEWEDGTSIEIKAGVAFGPESADELGYYPVRLDGYYLRVRPQAGVIAFLYTPDPPYEAEEQGPYTLKNEALLNGRARYGQDRLVSRQQLALTFVDDVKDAGTEKQGTITLSCARLRIQVPAGDIEAVEQLAGLMGAYQSRIEGPRARSGATVYWPDGHKAGTTSRDVGFDGEVSPSDNRRCFEKKLRYVLAEEKQVRKENVATLCFDPEDVAD